MRNNHFLRSVVLVSLFLLISCDLEDPASSESGGTHEFFLMNIVENSAYFTTFSNLEQDNVTNADGYEVVQMARPMFYKNMVFAAEFSLGDNITKYTRGSDGRLTKGGAVNLGSGSQIGEIAFAGDTKAYASMLGLGKMGIFNPTTMEKIGEIDLNPYAADDNNPSPGMCIFRDGKVFVALTQKTSQMTAHDSAWVAIIDVATDEVEKVIIDPRVTGIGFAGHGNAFMDENNHIYFYSHGMFGYQEGAKEGFLRIKSGETEWDEDFHYSMSELTFDGVTGSKAIYTMAMEYGGDGIVYAMGMVPGQTSNPPDYENDKNYQPCKLDFINNTITKIDLPATCGYGAMGITRKDDTVIFALAAEGGVGLYTYDSATGETSGSPVTTVEGYPNYVKYFGD